MSKPSDPSILQDEQIPVDQITETIDGDDVDDVKSIDILDLDSESEEENEDDLVDD